MDKSDNLDKLNKRDQLDKSDTLDKFGRLDQLDKSDKLDKLETIDKSDRLDQLGKLGKSSSRRTERPPLEGQASPFVGRFARLQRREGASKR